MKIINNENKSRIEKFKEWLSIILIIITATIIILTISLNIFFGFNISYEIVLTLALLFVVGGITFFDYIKINGLLEVRKTNEELRQKLDSAEIKNNQLLSNMMSLSVSNKNSVILNIDNSISNPLLDVKQESQQGVSKEKSNTIARRENGFSESKIIDDFIKDRNIPKYVVSFDKTFSNFFNEINPLKNILVDAYYKYNDEECFIEIKKMEVPQRGIVGQIKNYLYSIYLYNSLRKVNAKLVLVISSSNKDKVQKYYEDKFSFELEQGLLEIKCY